jgi:hypothetical protein
MHTGDGADGGHCEREGDGEAPIRPLDLSGWGATLQRSQLMALEGHHQELVRDSIMFDPQRLDRAVAQQQRPLPDTAHLSAASAAIVVNDWRRRKSVVVQADCVYGCVTPSGWPSRHRPQRCPLRLAGAAPLAELALADGVTAELALACDAPPQSVLEDVSCLYTMTGTEPGTH